MSIRSAASCGQPLQRKRVPRGARTVRGCDMARTLACRSYATIAGVSWYLADLVVQFDVQDDPRGVVHVNTCLIEAESPEDAHDKALRLGKDAQSEYENP